MENILFVTAQPDVPYFIWQIKLYIHNFVEKGINPLYILLSVIVILALLISILRGVRISLRSINNRKEGKAEGPSLTFWEEAKEWMSGHLFDE